MASESSTAGALLGCGNPLLDISAEVPMAVLEKYGVQLNSAVLAEESHLPVYTELTTDYTPDFIAGGSTLNTIRVAQWMSAAGTASYVGCIGTDEFGNRLKAELQAEGVGALLLEDPETPTGTCAVLIHNHERSLIANLAAANCYKFSHFEQEAQQAAMQAARVIYIAGFFLTVSVDTITHVAQHAAAEGKIFAMNISAPFLVHVFGEQLDSAMYYCDFVFANETEARTLGEVKGWGDDVGQLALKTAALPKASGTRPRVVVYTQGADSTMVACNGQVKSYPVEALGEDLLVDVNGAGDAFVGGFLAALVRGADMDACVAAGHWAARVIIQRSGCTFPSEMTYQW